MLVVSAALVIVLAALAPRSAHPSSIRDVEAGVSRRGPWSAVQWWRVTDDPGLRWYRLSILGNAETAVRYPLSLVLSGPFSAKVYVNGTFAGSKGQPSASARDERPGPIDGNVPIGPFLKAGPNEVVIEVSSHTLYGGGVLFQNLSVARAPEDARRSPRQYGIAVFFAGLLVALSVFFAERACRYPRSGYGWLAAGALAAVIALGAEIARSFIDYSYPWHTLRLLVIWAALVAASAAIGQFVAAHFAGSRRPLFVGAGVALCAAFAAHADTKTAAGVAIFLFSACLSLMQARGEEREKALGLAAFIIPWIGLVATRPSDVLDNGIYVFFALLFTALGSGVKRVVEGSPKGKTDDGELTIDGISFAAEKVRAVHAAGNYSQVEFVDGSGNLLRVPLKTIAKEVPGLVRTHRSHLVRLDGNERLKRGPSRRRTLVLGNGGTIPVSRSCLPSLRDSLRLRSHRHEIA